MAASSAIVVSAVSFGVIYGEDVLMDFGIILLGGNCLFGSFTVSKGSGFD